MGNPLTSKERRGVVAVAAAALLCIGAGFVFRGCSHSKVRDEVLIIQDGGEAADSSRSCCSLDSCGKDNGTERFNKADGSKRGNRKGKKGEKVKKEKEKKKKGEKGYPVRDPLSQPCD